MWTLRLVVFTVLIFAFKVDPVVAGSVTLYEGEHIIFTDRRAYCMSRLGMKKLIADMELGSLNLENLPNTCYISPVSLFVVEKDEELSVTYATRVADPRGNHICIAPTVAPYTCRDAIMTQTALHGKTVDPYGKQTQQDIFVLVANYVVKKKL